MFDWFLNKSLYGEQHMKDLQKKYSGKQENHFWLTEENSKPKYGESVIYYNISIL